MPTRSIQLGMLHRVHMCNLQLWRATPFVRHDLQVAAVVASRRADAFAARMEEHHFPPTCSAAMSWRRALRAARSANDRHVRRRLRRVRVLHSDRAANAGAWLTGPRVSGVGASSRAAHVLRWPTCCGVAAGRAHVLRSRRRPGARAASSGRLLFASGDFLLKVRATARTRRTHRMHTG